MYCAPSLSKKETYRDKTRDGPVIPPAVWSFQKNRKLSVQQYSKAMHSFGILLHLENQEWINLIPTSSKYRKYQFPIDHSLVKLKAELTNAHRPFTLIQAINLLEGRRKKSIR